MAQQLQTISLSAPAFYGINTQDSPTDLDHTYALVADNCVIDKFGRIGARKGFNYLTNVDVDITAISELVRKDGSTMKVYCGGLKIYMEGDINITPSGATITSDDWKIQEINNILVLVAYGNDPIVIYEDATQNIVCQKMTSHPTASGTPIIANECLAAYGRLWMASSYDVTQTVYWSDLLIPCAWNTGSAGSIDVSKVWSDGSDIITAIAEHNNQLIIFGTRQILVYQDGTNASASLEPSTMVLKDKITGIGCIARDSVISIGTDILFLSASGVRSLGRTIQEHSAPLRDVSLNVREELLEYVSRQDTPVKGGYSERYSLYLLAFKDRVYCFNLSGALQNGSFRATTWSGGIVPNCFYQTKKKSLLLGKRGVAVYEGYLDGGYPYLMQFFSGYLDFQAPFTQKFLKKLGVVLIGGEGSRVRLKWAYDHEYRFDYRQIDIASKLTSEYGVGEFGSAVFDEGISARTLSTPTAGSGAVVQVGIEAEVVGKPLSIQRINVYATRGASV